MPCYDPSTPPYEGHGLPRMSSHDYTQPPPTYYPPVQPTQELAVEPLLCSACRVLARLGYDFDENPALALWWDQHKKKDKAKKK